MPASLSEVAPAPGWSWGAYLLRPAQRQLLRGGQAVEVEDRVFDLLLLLLRNRDRALDRQEVITAIWGKRPVSDATLRQLVYKTRRAVGDDGEHQTTISTLYGRSLQWVAAVEALPGPASAPVGGLQAGAPLLRPPASAGADSPPTVDRRRLPDRRRAPAPGIDAIGPHIPGLAPPVESSTRAVAPRRRASNVRRAAWFIAVLALLAAAGAVVWALRPARVGGIDSAAPGRAPAGVAASAPDATLAVLPFTDVGLQPDQRYVSDGLTDELINHLARMPHLRVIARTSSFVFRDKPMDVREVARRLGVANVLEGSVQRSGDHWRVHVALVDARNGFELWADEYDAGSGDLLNIEDRIAGSVVKTLYPKLEAAAYASRRDSRQVAPAAHDAYLVGLEYMRRRDTSDIERAIAYFQRSAELDPRYADAWVGMAAGYAVLRDYDADAVPDAHYDDALAAVRKAIMLDPRSAHAHAVLGMLHMRHWQWPQAAAEYQRALQLDPNDATTHQWYGIYFWFIGDMQGALRQMHAAYQLDPLSPIINADLSRALLYTGDVDGAVAQARKTVVLAPRFELAHLFLASALGAKGRYADAVSEIRAGIALAPSPPASDDLTFLRYMEWAQGDHADARRLLDEVEARARSHYVSGVALAELEWPVGYKDRAFANLTRAALDHDSLLMTVSGVRDDAWCLDPRFPKLLASMHLPVR